MIDDIIEHYWSSGQEEYIDFESTQLSTTIYEPDIDPKNTIVGVCGGPGCPKEYLAPLSILSKDGYRVILYDQHNIGRSGSHDKPYQISTFINELNKVLSVYNCSIIVGHSWGAMLGLQYCIEEESRPFVGVSPLFDVQDSIQIAKTRRSEVIDSESTEILSRIELGTDVHNNGLYDNINNRVKDKLSFKPPVPSFIKKWGDKKFNQDMYENMWGHSEFKPDESAVLYNWSVKDRVGSINCPTLFTTGRDDVFGYHNLYSTANKMDYDSSVRIIEDASHNPIWESPIKFRKIILSWLSNISN